MYFVCHLKVSFTPPHHYCDFLYYLVPLAYFGHFCTFLSVSYLICYYIYPKGVCNRYEMGFQRIRCWWRMNLLKKTMKTKYSQEESKEKPRCSMEVMWQSNIVQGSMLLIGIGACNISYRKEATRLFHFSKDMYDEKKKGTKFCGRGLPCKSEKAKTSAT